MFSSDRYPRLKDYGRTKEELENKNTIIGVEHAKTGLGVSWYFALSKVIEAVTNFFNTYKEYFFVANVILSLISWAFFIKEYRHTANQNRGKTADLILRGFVVSFMIAMGVVYLTVGPLVGGIMLLCSLFIDPIVNFGKAIYYLIRARLLTEQHAELKTYFKNKAKDAALIGVLGAIASGIFVVLMCVAFPPAWIVLGVAVSTLWVTIPLGIIGSGIALLPLMAQFGAWLKNKLNPPTQSATTPAADKTIDIRKSSDTIIKPPLPVTFYDRRSSRVVIDNEEEVHETMQERKVQGYYANSFPPQAVSLAGVERDIGAYIAKLEDEIKRDGISFIENYVWSQNPKRLQKIAALKFLQLVTAHIKENNIEITAPIVPLMIGDVPFTYKNLDELVLKISQHVLAKYPKAFQSLGKEIGDTQACFNNVYLCIIGESHRELEDKRGFSL